MEEKPEASQAADELPVSDELPMKVVLDEVDLTHETYGPSALRDLWSIIYGMREIEYFSLGVSPEILNP